MIRTKTVLVLGAGASKPYGFPTGGEIAEDIHAEHRSDGGLLTRVLLEGGFEHDNIRTFRQKFKESGQYSLDAFIQRRPQFKDIAKAAMAARLMTCETENERAQYPPAHLDWYRFLFAGMMPKDDAVLFVENQLTVITFNFDRSFEYRLYRVLEGTYEIPPQEVDRLARALPVLHIHGQFGALDIGSGVGRPYGAVESASGVVLWSKEIRLLNEELEKGTLEKAQEALQQAERVYFIGFSFHVDNLARLRADGLGNKTLFGTCKGMSTYDQSRVYACFNSPRKGYLLDRDAREFFDQVPIFSQG